MLEERSVLPDNHWYIKDTPFQVFSRILCTMQSAPGLMEYNGALGFFINGFDGGSQVIPIPSAVITK
jgi:hypothetical protein